MAKRVSRKNALKSAQRAIDNFGWGLVQHFHDDIKAINDALTLGISSNEIREGMTQQGLDDLLRRTELEYRREERRSLKLSALDAIGAAEKGQGDLTNLRIAIADAIEAGNEMEAPADLVLVLMFGRAKRVLEDLRNNRGNLAIRLGVVGEALRSGISYEELGTSAEELNGFPRAYAIARAKEALADLRRNMVEVNRGMKAIDNALGLGVTLTELGSTEVEIKGFPRAHLLEEARRALVELRQPNLVFRQLSMQSVEKALAYGISLEELGSNAAEWEQLSQADNAI